MSLSKMENSNYNHTSIEKEIYNYWEKNNFFKPRKNKKKHLHVFLAFENTGLNIENIKKHKTTLYAH